MPLSLAQLSAHCGGSIAGDGDVLITGVASLQAAQRGQLAFFSGGNVRTLAATGASAVLLRADDAECAAVPAGVARWLVDGEPRLYFARAIEQLYPLAAPAYGVSPAAVIHDSAHLAGEVAIAPAVVVGSEAQIGSGCIIHAGVVIGSGVVVGAGSVLYPNVVLYPRVVVGSGCTLHAGVVIGADGFGYAENSSGGSDKIRQLGGVKIGNDVEVGANSAIDCGALDDTVIGDGVRIDNLVQIGHNVTIGESTIICGKVGIAGSSRLGSRCLIGGNASIAGHLTIGDDVKIAGTSVVTHNIESGGIVSSVMPAMPIRTWRRFVAGLRRQLIK